MAIDKEPQKSSSDAKSKESSAKINRSSPKLSKSDASNNPDLQENLLVPVTPQTDLKPLSKKQENVKIIPPKRPLWKLWQVWGIILVLCSGGLGYGATTMLLKLPKTQSCSKVFWPIASASIRLYCAQTAAENKDVDGLLNAIDLVAVLPDSHPLRPEIDRNINRWATSILEIGEEEFQTGKLKQAISTARKIPNNVSAKELVDEKITNWKDVWSKGEETYSLVEDKLREGDWNGAFNTAVRLTDNNNEYWATTKYEESINNINIAQEQRASLDKAVTQITSGQVDDLILAIGKADDIDKKSYTYEQAQEIRASAKEKLVNNIEGYVANQDWQQLLRVVNRVPGSLNLQTRVKDWQILANAGSSSELDTVFGMEEAIEEAKKLERKSEYYQLGQTLISRWEKEIGGVRHLTKARRFAQIGTINNLSKAITEAGEISSSNPRYAEARQEIGKWRGQIQIIEDQPILTRARELSYGNNTNAWRRAIAEISLISSNSPLYGDAQNYVRTWRANIQKVEDQPIINEADSFASVNNYPAAIESAKRVASGRALYPDAQSRISRWQAELDGERYSLEANDLASQRTPEALARAITIARQVPSGSSARSQVVIDINDWAAEILDQARQESDNSLERAIEIALQVPSGTSSHNIAQGEIKIWRIRLQPSEPEIVPPTFKLDKFRKEREEDN